MKHHIEAKRIQSIIALLLCALVIALMSAIPVSAASSSDNHGRDAHSDSMTVGPDKTEESAHSASAGSSDSASDSKGNITDENADEAAENDDSLSAGDGTTHEDETTGLGKKFWIALAVIGAAIVVDLYYIVRRLKQRLAKKKNESNGTRTNDSSEQN